LDDRTNGLRQREHRLPALNQIIAMDIFTGNLAPQDAPLLPIA
jgi:hypothetical protein